MNKVYQKIKNNISIWHSFIPVVAIFAAVGTQDRIIHFLWALVFSLIPMVIFIVLYKMKIGYSYFFVESKDIGKLHQVIMILFVLFLGSWIPDIDWEFKSHRSPITHSVLPFWVMLSFSKIFKTEWDKKLLVFFGLGLASHLITDIIPGGNVVWLPAKLDMPFLFLNGSIVIYLSYKVHIKGVDEHQLEKDT